MIFFNQGIRRAARRALSSETVHHAAIFFAYRAVALVIFAISLPIFVRHSSAQEYGVVALAFSLFTLATLMESVATYVVAQVTARSVARRGHLSSTRLESLFSLFFYFGLLLAIGVWVVLPFLSLPSSSNLLLASTTLSLPFLAVSGVAAAIHQGAGSLPEVNKSRFMFEAGKGLALVTSALLTQSFALVAGVLLVIVATRCVHDLKVLQRRHGLRFKAQGIAEASRVLPMLGVAAPAGAATALTCLVAVADKAIIIHLLSAADVARYSVAVDLATKAYIFAYALNSSLLSLWIRNRARNVDTQAQMRLAVGAVLVFSLCYFVPLSIWGSDVVRSWLGAELASSIGPVLALCSMASICYLVGNIYEVSFLAKARATKVLSIYVVAAALYFTTVVPLARAFGLTGFGVALVIYNASYLIGVLILHRFRNR